jgi:hypothetical protein
VAILIFLQREPAKQRRIQAHSRKDDHYGGEDLRKFLDWNNRDNHDKQNHRNNGHQDRKHGPDNTMVVADKANKFSKPRKFDDIENMHCIWHPNSNHTTGDYRIFIGRYTRRSNNGERKEDN